MNNLVPFIPSEPPPISNESFEHESYNTEIYSPYKSRDSIDNIIMPEEAMEIDNYSNIQPNRELYQYESYGRDNDLQGSRNPIELYQYIENVITENNLRVDFTDSAVVNEDKDKISVQSFDGEFDDYINQTCFDKGYSNDIPVLDNPSNDTSTEIVTEVDNIERKKIIDLNAFPPNQDVSDDFPNKCNDLKIDGSVNNPNENLKADNFGDFACIAEMPHADNDMPVLDNSSNGTPAEIVTEVDNLERNKFINLNVFPLNQDVSENFLSKCSDLKIDGSVNNPNENLKADNFGDFAFVAEMSYTNYFPSTANEEPFNSDVKSVDFADFTDFANYSHEIKESEKFPEFNQNCMNEDNKPCTIDDFDDDFDDDFEDFATFENVPENTILPDNLLNEKSESEKSEQTLKELLENILVNFSSVESELSFSQNITDSSSITRSDSFISNQTLFNDVGLFLWKELTNYDYSPAFIFQWMQSATYEKFMESIGPEYKEMLSSHRAALPLFSVNLTPIEPVPADNCIPANVSASSSNIDLRLKDECGIGVCERNSTINFKNLEEEFIFDKFSNASEIVVSDIALTNSSSLSNISSTVIQSERFGGILKSILKPLNSTKASPVNKPINPQVEAVLKELPDLSYMSSKVLMFPVISTCDVEDNI